MQVSHAADHVTHAVIAPAEAIEFSISTSAEFFQILSSTLYTNQKLAVVREVLCNAWDAHIASERTTTPIEITITDSKLEIRDYGFGIPKEMIGQIYGTYGNSTKKNDGLQTGGFGLGSKSPFAYVDHFEVESFCQGERTIYALSKSSAERMGKPGITPIVTIPTEETGLRVSIPIQRSDRSDFKDLVKEIVRNGEMLAKLNEELLPTLPFSETESNWLVVQDRLGYDHVRVRYGNVIYPVPEHSEYNHLLNSIKEFMDSLRRENSYFKLILQAPPHSISVTPSREALSLQAHTITTLTKLLEDFREIFRFGLLPKMTSVLKEHVDQAAKDGLYGELLNHHERLPATNAAPEPKVVPEVISTVNDLAVNLIRARYPRGDVFRKMDLTYRLDTALKLNFGKRGHLEQVRKRIRTLGIAPVGPKAAHLWFARKIKAPLLAAMQNDPGMNHKALYVYGRNNDRSTYPQILLKEFQPHSYSDCLPLLRNVVALTHSRADLDIRLPKFPEMASLGQIWGVYVYAAPPSQKKLPAIREFFLKRGFTLLDLTVPQPWDPPKPVNMPTLVKAPATPKETGFSKLSAVRDGYGINKTQTAFAENAPKISNPKCYLRVPYSRTDYQSFAIWSADTNQTTKFIQYYGDICAVIRNDRDEEKLKKLGVPTLDDYAIEEVVREFTTNQKFLDYWEDSGELAMYRKNDFYRTSMDTSLIRTLRIPEVRTALDLKIILQPLDYILLDVWWNILVSRRHEIFSKLDTSPLKPVIDLFAVTQLSPTLQTIKQARPSTLLSMLALDNLRKLFAKSANTPQDTLDRAANIIKIALTG